MTTRPASARRRRLVVVGSGVAGLTGAIRAADPARGEGADVVLLTKARLADSNSMLAQGGFAAVLPEGQCAPGDSVASHAADTVAAGAGHGNRGAIEAMCAAAAGAVEALVSRGVGFDRDADGRLALGLEAAHSFPRILHAGGDASGAGISLALIAVLRRLEAEGRVQVLEGAAATEILLEAGEAVGVAYTLAGGAAAPHTSGRISADAVLLATGGAGQLYAQTTNPAVATGDGVALAYRAGAVLRDLEFYQFHPTALQTRDADGRLRSQLVSEAVRGEGAVIRDAAGRRFVGDYHALGELAPRDAVSRALALHARAGGGQAFLDATGLEERHGRGFLARRFPGLDAMTRAAGFDWRREPLPIGPAAHYWMGGVATDLDGATSVPGLYAAGETACTGVHGANRLASNSLLEGAVFAARAVEHALSRVGGAWHGPSPAGEHSILSPEAEDQGTPGDLLAGAAGRARLAAAMQADAGVLREREGLDRLRSALGSWASEEPEAANLLTLGRLLAAAAAARGESLGSHFRLDAPQRRADGLGAAASIDVVRAPAIAGRTS
ncbi:L-aspartate oxidase [Sinomonas sp. R1AF57]|uniref:L-aspartate oxidase n=1 Tax=Sinomonas sp. R1AF57 TaxID=2020377 RepID=UPI000B60391A|nr:FAD-binding protein [Sinomonas sp. R1AF57]ASN52249.1 L-aspartate oxidase [Sinomonas sp. R1AF57]